MNMSSLPEGYNERMGQAVIDMTPHARTILDVTQEFGGDVAVFSDGELKVTITTDPDLSPWARC